MRHLRNQRGYSILESIVVMMAFAIVFASTCSMMVQSVRCFDIKSNQSYMDLDAAMGINRIIADVRTAKTMAIQTGGTSLLLNYPVVVHPTSGTDYYNRKIQDTGNTVLYYLSDITGSTTKTGSYLWRTTNGKNWMVSKNIQSLLFETVPGNTTGSAVQITVVANSNTTTGKTMRPTQLTDRVVYLRNN